MMSEDTIRDIVNVITTRLSPRRVILFGSYARGEAGPDSDLDLFVELDPPLPARGRSSVIKELFDPYPGPMDIVVYSPDEVAYWKQAPAQSRMTGQHQRRKHRRDCVHENPKSRSVRRRLSSLTVSWAQSTVP